MVIYLMHLGGFKAFVDIRVNVRQALLKEPGGCSATSLLLSFSPKMLTSKCFLCAWLLEESLIVVVC